MPPRNPASIALRKLEQLLPGRPAANDARWTAMLAVQDEFILSHPEEIWEFVVRWSKHPQTDLCDAVACCLLEHLLENHFRLLFPRVRAAAAKSRRFTDTLRRCYWLGEAAFPKNALSLDRLVGERRPRFRPRRCAMGPAAITSDHGAQT
jgi:hypothetical protein